jgi:hypothetical protein
MYTHRLCLREEMLSSHGVLVVELFESRALVTLVVTVEEYIISEVPRTPTKSRDHALI